MFKRINIFLKIMHLICSKQQQTKQQQRPTSMTTTQLVKFALISHEGYSYP